MNKKNWILTTMLSMGIVGAATAESAINELQQSIRQLRQQENELKAQGKKLEQQRHTLEAKVMAKKHQKEFDAAIAGLKVQKPKKKRTILIYSRTESFRHDSIPYGILTLTELGKRTGAFDVVASEDPKVFLSKDFMSYDGVLMLNTTGANAVPAGPEREAFEKFLKQEKGLMGIHAATDCHQGWEGYREAMGGLFDGHPWNRNSVVTLYNEEPQHPICSHIKTGDTIRDEIYQYKDDKHFTRNKLRILLSLDLSGENMKKAGMKRKDHDYAVSWIRKYQGSRVFYSNLGHNKETFHNPMALQHFLNGIQFALGDMKADARPSSEVGNGKAQPLPAGF